MVSPKDPIKITIKKSAYKLSRVNLFFLTIKRNTNKNNTKTNQKEIFINKFDKDIKSLLPDTRNIK